MVAIASIKPYTGNNPSLSSVTWQIGDSSDFSNIVQEVPNSTTMLATFYTSLTPPTGATYYIRAKRYFSDWTESSWTNAGSYTSDEYASNALLAENLYAEPPTVYVDEDELNDDNSTSFTLYTSKLRSNRGSHASSHWLIRTMSGAKKFQTFYDGTNKESIAVNKANMNFDAYSRFEVMAMHVTSDGFVTTPGRLVIQKQNTKYEVISNTKDIPPYDDYILKLNLIVPSPYPINRIEIKDVHEELTYGKTVTSGNEFIIPEEILEDNNTYYLDIIENEPGEVCCYDPTDGSLTAAFDMDSDVNDVSGNGYDLTNTNITFNDDFDLKRSIALFNGVDAYGVIPAELKPFLFKTTTVSHTLTGWLYFHGDLQLDDTYREDALLLSGGSSSAKCLTSLLLDMDYVEDASTATLYFGDVANTEYVSVEANLDNTAGWKHFAAIVVLDTTNGKYYLEFYLGTVFIGRVYINPSSPIISNVVDVSYIGRLWSDNSASSGFFGSKVHSLRYYNKPLTSTEVKDDANNPVKRMYRDEADRTRVKLTTSGVYEIFKVDKNFIYEELFTATGININTVPKHLSADQFMNNGIYLPIGTSAVPTPYLYLQTVPSLGKTQLPKDYLALDINNTGNVTIRVLNNNRVLFYRATGTSNVPQFTLYNTNKQELVNSVEMSDELTTSGLTISMTYVPSQNAVFYFAKLVTGMQLRKLDLTTFTVSDMTNRTDLTTDYPTLVHMGGGFLFSINGGTGGKLHIYDVDKDQWVTIANVPAKYSSLEMESWLRKDGKIVSFNLRNGTSDVLLYDPATSVFLDVVSGLPEDLNLDSTVRLRSGEFLRYSASSGDTEIYSYR